MPNPPASSATVRKRMQQTRQRDTRAELRLRKLLHAIGLRYLVDAKPLAGSPRRADIVFTRAKVAVFVDGCFWHGCPVHGSWPKANEQFWRAKILANMERDENTNQKLTAQGWLVIRIWEHEDPAIVAPMVAARVRDRTTMSRQLRRPSG